MEHHITLKGEERRHGDDRVQAVGFEKSMRLHSKGMNEDLKIVCFPAQNIWDLRVERHKADGMSCSP